MQKDYCNAGGAVVSDGFPDQGDIMSRSLILFPLLLLCFACAQTAGPLPTISRPTEIPSPVAPQVEKEQKAPKDTTREMLSFSLREADIKDVLRAIARQTNYNMVVEQEVKGLVTVDLKNVTLDKSLQYLLEPLNFASRIDDNTIYVSRPKLETRVYPLNYVALKRTGSSTIRGSSGSDRNAKQGAVALRSDTDSDLWKAIEEGLKNLLSPDGRYVINRTASLMAVTDYQKNLKNVAAFVDAVEKTIQRQVSIEAKIIEVLLNDDSRAGIDWDYLQKRWTDLNIAVRQTPVGAPDPVDNAVNATTFKPCFHFEFANGRQEALVELLKTQGKVNVVSNPRIAALTNQRAVIKVATEDVTFETTTTVTEGGIPVVSTTNQFITVGLVLDVIPQVDKRGNIIMSIHPILTERIGERIDRRTGNSVPILDVREVDTMIRLREGETVILGGLVKDRSGGSGSGRSELVIFLTPRVISGKDPI
jgi:MSHA biogenesis protein MshL